MNRAGQAREFTPERLDDQSTLLTGDSAGVLRLVASSAAQARIAYRAAQEAGVAGLAREGRPRAIVVVGMGDSGIAGDMLDAVCGNSAPLPIVTVRGLHLPGWVGAADLVIAISRSGRTEETVTLAAEAVRRGCRMLGVGEADSPLAALVARAGGPFVPVSGGAAARVMLWELVIPPIVAAAALGLVGLGEAVVEAVAARLEDVAHRCRPSSESFINPGKTLALELADSIPAIWATSPLTRVAAYRLACQLAENAGYPAVWGEIPEVAHNQIAIVDGPLAGRDVFHDPFVDEPSGPRLRLILLRDAVEHPQVARRRGMVVRLAEDRGVPVSELVAEGAHPLERLAGLIGLVDFASVYLGLGYGIDPAAVAAAVEIDAGVSS